jgi:hypothetical protein
MKLQRIAQRLLDPVPQKNRTYRLEYGHEQFIQPSAMRIGSFRC